MPSSLGIYIEDNLIKYAKVSKDKDNLKVDSFNVVFYEELETALEKIITETNSGKLPICVNVVNELYNYYEVFSMLSKKDIKHSVDIDFELLCSEKNYNRNSLETRHILAASVTINEKLKALHIAVNKSDIARKMQLFSYYKLNSLTPMPTSIVNVLDIKPKENIAIINIEKETKITTVVNGEISRIDTLEIGMGQILEDLTQTENSIQKAYEMCKNITIYTQGTQSLPQDESECLYTIMPTINKLVSESKQVLDSVFANVSKVYITGQGAVINNIDLYFQDYMPNVKCEILKPYFVESGSLKIPVKDYIEVNSAIALAMESLGYGNKELNFKTFKSAFAYGGIEAKSKSNNFLGKRKNEAKNGKLDLSFSKETLDRSEKLMLRIVAISVMVIMVFGLLSNYIMNEVEIKKEEINLALETAQAEVAKLESDTSKINSKTSQYTLLINSIKNLTESNTEDETKVRVIAKDAIPNLLNRIMFVIPQKVQITSIKNTADTHIVIEAQATQYEQLGYFKAVLDTQGVLENVKSTSGLKDGSVVKVTIEGDLP